MTVDHPTPKSRATQTTERFCSPTRRHASARARSVIDARGAIASVRSLHVATPQSESIQHVGSVLQQLNLVDVDVEPS